MSTQSRLRVLTGLLIVMTLIAAAAAVWGWQASTQRRPAEEMAPNVKPLTVAAAAGPLRDIVRLSCEKTPSASFQLTAGDTGIDTRVVITEVLLDKGAAVEPGEILMEVNGTPIVVIAGDFPLYRKLEAGMNGPDIAMLQAFLASQGYFPGNSKTMDERTENAWRAMLMNSGHNLSAATPISIAPGNVLVFPADEQLRIRNQAERGAVLTGEQTIVELDRGADGFACTSGGQKLPAGLVSVGSEVNIEKVGSSEVVKGTVGSLPSSSSESEAARGSTDADSRANVNSTPDTSIDGTQTFIRVPTDALPGEYSFTLGSSSEDAIVVPASAVWFRENQAAVVTVLEADGATHDVAITVTVSANGRIAVEPAEGLMPGTNVIVGETLRNR